MRSAAAEYWCEGGESSRFIVGRKLPTGQQWKGGEEVDLANTLGVSQEVLSTWLDLKVAVPGRQQKTIAAWLRRPIADLFTDVDPNVVVEEPKEADAPA